MATLAALRPKCERRAPKKFDEMSSSDSEGSDSERIMYKDSSESEIAEAADIFEGSMSFCTNVSLCSKARTRKQQIAETEFICEFC